MSATRNTTPDITIQIAPKSNYLVALRNFISCLAESLGIGEEEAAHLEMCLDEACANSFEAMQETFHSKNHFVQIDVHIEEQQLHITIHDSGQDYTPYIDRAQPMGDGSDVTQRRGYGLRIIKTLMDEVRYVHQPGTGNILYLTKYISK